MLLKPAHLLIILLMGLFLCPMTLQAETDTQRDERMKWWREARFGMFVHWGLYSNAAGEWEGRKFKGGGVEWIQLYAGVPADQYQQKMLPQFKPKPGFADEWAKLAKEAGCKYVVYTNKHHEGFSMHDSAVTTYDAKDVTGRDIHKEIVNALGKQNLKVGVYHSLWDWHHPDAYAGPGATSVKGTSMKGRQPKKYVDYLHKQVKEIVTNYGSVDVMWFDYSSTKYQGQSWGADQLLAMVRKHQPQVIVNNRLYRSVEAGWPKDWSKGFKIDPKYGDFSTPEQHIPPTGMPGVDWETCMTMNGTWGYGKYHTKWKSSKVLIQQLIDTVSKGGNYLLNIGPLGDGTVPKECVERMQDIGKWMKINSESIYGTTASPFIETPFGRCTQKTLPNGNTRLYLHVFNWPKDGQLLLSGLTNQPTKATLLHNNKALQTSSDRRGVTLTGLPRQMPDTNATVIVLNVIGKAKVVERDPWKTETKTQRAKRMKWWQESRFGMFIHWGLYAVPAGEWQGKTNHAEWIRTTARIPLKEYNKFVGQFNPVKFDADLWVKMAKQAGMKYIVITSKHHDGFCLWPSKLTDYDITSTPFKRDILDELTKACKKHDVRMCFYHSVMDWHHPDYLPRRGWEAKDRPVGNADYKRYVTYMKGQLKELVERYEPGVMWFDGEWEKTWTHEMGKDLYWYMLELDKNIIVNNRVDKGRRDMAGLTKSGDYRGDFGTPEQEIPATGLPGVDWESCMTMNGHWGYNKHDKSFKSTKDLIHKLVDIASKGGNYLLNIGPKADGTFPEESIQRLKEIGQWMAINGDSIYATTASPFGKLPWGRCTVKVLPQGNTRLYLHVFNWPTDGTLIVPGLANQPQTVSLLATPSVKLNIKRNEENLLITLPKQAPDKINTVIVLDIAGSPKVTKPKIPLPTNDGAGRITLTPKDAKITGSAKIEKHSGGSNIGLWTNKSTTVSFEFRVKKSGMHEIVLTYACKNDSAGSKFVVEVDGKKKRGQIKGTGSGWHKYKQMVLGSVNLKKGVHTMVIKPTNKPGLAVMNLKQVQLQAILD